MRLLFAVPLLSLLATPAIAGDVEPRLTLPAGTHAVALTFDACSGGVDERILDELIADRVPATIFVTHRWLKRNAVATTKLLAHADLFEIENHGENHVPAITDRPTVFGLQTAGSLSAVLQEVTGGAGAVSATFGRAPIWYRDASARYSRDATQLIAGLGYRIAGYSLNADVGASLPAATVSKRVGMAKPGDVIIAHINHPERPAGAGVVEGIKILLAKGVRFERLDAAFPTPTG
ncbi:polysaccharide deacetylase family protein [Pleomorphomonas sp. JP5]|uniref:polysaccharide deacetylase family protein n=1 Tax=Pleomorphomonas sp. JP5 TaxID=2942998 RepID=UPI002044CCA7|nr:polysaccharide deacetylase family protein [Pleomorphomonas sp. JP5]MCM5558208.1 polysaccharide deacetylase family protein [Pleomorphomonas sp. JP5]